MRWGLTAHTVAMFCVVTMSVAVGLYPLPVSYINNREFPGNDDAPPGPYGYGFLPKFTPVTVAANSAIQVNQWLVDGLLVRLMLNSTIPVSNLGRFNSSIVATSSMA